MVCKWDRERWLCVCWRCRNRRLMRLRVGRLRWLWPVQRRWSRRVRRLTSVRWWPARHHVTVSITTPITTTASHSRSEAEEPCTALISHRWLVTVVVSCTAIDIFTHSRRHHGRPRPPPRQPPPLAALADTDTPTQTGPTQWRHGVAMTSPLAKNSNNDVHSSLIDVLRPRAPVHAPCSLSD